MPLTSPGNDDDTGENHQPTLRKNTAEPVEQTLKQNNSFAWSECATISMAAGHPLTDEDRWPWLDTIAAWIDERVAAGEPAVVTCSALKKIYRDKLRRQGVVFVYMQGTFDEVMERLSHRQGHFMKPSMLQSQSDILEEPGDDEIHVNVHIGQADPEHEAMAVAGALGL